MPFSGALSRRNLGARSYCMRLERDSWGWWFLMVGSPLALIAAIVTLVGGSKLWLLVLIIGVVLVLVGSPIWMGLRAPKER